MEDEGGVNQRTAPPICALLLAAKETGGNNDVSHSPAWKLAIARKAQIPAAVMRDIIFGNMKSPQRATTLTDAATVAYRRVAPPDGTISPIETYNLARLASRVAMQNDKSSFIRDIPGVFPQKRGAHEFLSCNVWKVVSYRPQINSFEFIKLPPPGASWNDSNLVDETFSVSST